MNVKTYLAVGEAVQAAAHIKGIVGPVEFTVCGSRDYFKIASDDEDMCKSLDDD